ncbi:hypothetical protein KMC66_gp41 [Staphylococcus phage TEM126]|uniref:Uncharacterized protein n=2 Tax=root TaxID=1 RepID=E9LT71_9CAUD|nr:hypothetical protein KMC66_gp41 [Staphylococcus phage TEM126]ADV76519.1 hypothetical protein [Staphylococcus phage TEM126]
MWRFNIKSKQRRNKKIMESYEEIEHIHINTGRKKLTQEEIEEANAFIESQEFKNMVKQAKESRQRVMNSKITNRTKM